MAEKICSLVTPCCPASRRKAKSSRFFRSQLNGAATILKRENGKITEWQTFQRLKSILGENSPNRLAKYFGKG